jgi:F-type H+-transporting ATPase subunit b
MHEPVLVPDFTIFIQVGLFFASYFVLNALVYKPYLALLKARRESTVGMKEQAEKNQAEAEKLRIDYEAVMKVERKKIAAWAEEERKKIQEEERTQIQTARNAAAKKMEESRLALENEKKAALKSLEGNVGEFSSAIVSKMLGRNIQVGTGTPGKKSEMESAVPT